MTAPAENPRGGDVCQATHPHLSPENYCREPVGHGGQHMAHDDEGRPEYVWTTGDVWDWAPDPTPPVAGRGDTDSGGEGQRPVCGCEQGMGHMDRGCHSYGLCHAQSAERAARPAGDRAQPTEELREAIRQTLRDTTWVTFRAGDGHLSVAQADEGDVADALLAGPLAALLDAQAKVERVEALCEDGGHEGWVSARAVRRALDGA